MDWTNKNVHPSKVAQLGDEVEVMVLEIDEERRRISLGMKQCMPNPWEEFAMNHKKGDKVKGQIKSITDFGIFIGLPGGIDGLVHLSDLSWGKPGEEAVRDYKKSQDVETVVLSIDVERERISLGIKQIEGDPFNSFIQAHEKNSMVNGTVKSIDAKGAVILLDGDVEGYLRASEVARERVEDIRTRLKEGDKVTAMIINIDRKNRTINLSVKARDMAEDSEAMKKLAGDKQASTGTTNLGALLKAKLDVRQYSTIRKRHDQIRVDREAGGALPAAGGEGCGTRGEDDSRRHGEEPGAGAAHRNPGFRQFRTQLPAPAHRAQPEVGREGAGAGQVRAALQGGQGTARACGHQEISGISRHRLLQSGIIERSCRFFSHEEHEEYGGAGSDEFADGSCGYALPAAGYSSSSCSCWCWRFAVKNTDPVTVRYYFGGRVAGAAHLRAAGRVVRGDRSWASSPGSAQLIRQRREIAALKRELRQIRQGRRRGPGAIDAG